MPKLKINGIEVEVPANATVLQACQQAGVEVPITIYRDGETSEVRVKSGERDRFLKGPSLH